MVLTRAVEHHLPARVSLGLVDQNVRMLFENVLFLLAPFFSTYMFPDFSERKKNSSKNRFGRVGILCEKKKKLELFLENFCCVPAMLARRENNSQLQKLQITIKG